MSKHLTPTEVCEALIGKPDVLASICHIDPKAPFGWRQASKGREPGDIPHARHLRALLAHSAARQLGLTAEHLIWGAEAAQIEAILAARAGGIGVEFRPAAQVAAE